MLSLLMLFLSLFGYAGRRFHFNAEGADVMRSITNIVCFTPLFFFKGAVL
jgi:hypothetical protein